MATAGKLRKKDANQMVLLQIGENDFSMSRQNFRRLKGEFEEQRRPMPEGNKYILDRTSDLFKYILKYLRLGAISFPDDFEEGERLMKEAEFYGLDDLKKHLENGAGKPEIVTIVLMTPHEDKEKPKEQNILLLKVKVTSGYGTREWITPNSLPKERKATGVDIILHWSSERSKQQSTQWKTLVGGLLDKFNFKVYECEGINQHHVSFNSQWTVDMSETTFKRAVETSNDKSSRDFVFNVKDETVMPFISCFLCSGFILTTDKYSADKTRFRKEYKVVREMKFRRIKPVAEQIK